MARVLTGDKIIASIRKKTSVPDDPSEWDDVDILDAVDEEMNTQVLDKLLKLHAEHLIVTVDVPRNELGIFEIPYRAIGNKLRDASLISGGTTYELSQVSIGSLPDYSENVSTRSELDLFYIENNKLKLITPSRAYNCIRLRYYIRPSYLTKVEEAGIISDIVKDTGAGTLTLTLSQVGKSFNSTAVYDIVGNRTPNKIKNFDLTATSFTSGTTGIIVFDLDDLVDVDDIIVGDYVSLAEETPVPNIPTEMQPLLVQATAVSILESMGDFEGLARAEKRMTEMSAATQFLVDDRVELAPKKIRPRNGTLNSRYGSRFRK
jgi:hypothetical protein